MNKARSDILIECLQVRCRAYGLRVIQSSHKLAPLNNGDVEWVTTDQPGDYILTGDRPFTIELTIEWLGNSAIALLMLKPILFVDFFADPLGIGQTTKIGTSSVKTKPEKSQYIPSLNVDAPISLELTSGMYQIQAVVRVGANQGPALMSGVVDGLMIEVFMPSIVNSAKDSSDRKKRTSKPSKKHS